MHAALAISVFIRIPYNRRNTKIRFEVCLISEKIVVFKLLAMVRGDDNQCIVGIAALFQKLKNVVELIIDLADHAAIGCTKL